MQTSVIVSCVPPNLTIEQLKAHFGKNKKNNVIQVQWLKQPRTGSSGIAEVQVGSIEGTLQYFVRFYAAKIIFFFLAAQYLCDRKQIIKGHELHLFCPQTVSGCPEVTKIQTCERVSQSGGGGGTAPGTTFWGLTIRIGAVPWYNLLGRKYCVGVVPLQLFCPLRSQKIC